MMKKFFALSVVIAALFAAGCAKENDTMPPPAEDQAMPVDEGATDMPADDTTDTP